MRESLFSRPKIGKRNSRRRAAAWLGIAALLLHALVPAGAFLSRSAAADPLAGPIVLCTAFGPRVLPGPTEDAPRGAAFDHCVLCLANPAGKVLPPPAAAMFDGPRVSKPSYPPRAETAPARLAAISFLARGPPRLV
ncbi:MAG: hypothetical protein ACTSXZ_07890 [Alphaproteobacteria bacterium]